MDWGHCSPPGWARLAPSGRRDSNPRPSPWQGDALPTEPRPRDTTDRLGLRSRNHSRARRGIQPPIARGCRTRPRHSAARMSDALTCAIWVNGRLYGSADATCPLTDHGFVVGDGIFEALRITDAGLFAVQRHLDRMTRSAAALGLPRSDHAAVREGDRRGLRRPASSSASCGSPTRGTRPAEFAGRVWTVDPGCDRRAAEPPAPTDRGRHRPLDAVTSAAR